MKNNIAVIIGNAFATRYLQEKGAWLCSRGGTMDCGEGEDELLRHIRDIAESRALVLVTVVIDSILLTGVVLITIGLHYVIGPVSQYSLIDQFAIRGLQVVGAVGTVGPMLGYLLKDLIEIFRRIGAK